MGGSVSVPRKRVEPAAKYSPQYILKGNTEVAPTSSREKIGECGLAAQLEYAEQLSQQQEDQHSSCQNFDILDSKPILLMGGKRTWPHNDNPRGFQQFQFLKVIGSGAYSVVCSAVCRHSGQKVAIKRIANIFSRERDLTKTFLREAMILNHCNHPNVLKLRGLFTQGTDFDQVHFVTDLMDTDLHRVLRSNIILSVNLLVNRDCHLVVADFNLARCGRQNNTYELNWGGSSRVGDDGAMTEYVATRPYQAPEFLLCNGNYAEAVDVWAVGCVFAEMLRGSPLFEPRNYIQLLEQQVALLGSPTSAQLTFVTNRDALLFLQGPTVQGVTAPCLEASFPNAPPAAVDLLRQLLQFDPRDRITLTQALEHPFLAPVRCSGVSSQISSKNENELVVGTEIPTQTSETTDNQPTAVIVGEPGPVLPASTITLISSVGSDSTSSVVNGEPEAMQNGAPEVQNETTQEELVAGCESLACKPVPSWFESFSDVAQSSCPVQMINVSEMQTLLSAECDDQVESTKDTERHNNIVEEQHNVEQKLWVEASKAWLESTARMFPPASLSGRIPSISISSVRNRVKAPI